MGASPKPSLLPFDSKDGTIVTTKSSKGSAPRRRKVVEAQARRRKMKPGGGRYAWSRRSGGTVNGIERRVRALMKLVPIHEKVSGLDELFMETADYILLLQMQVKAMQVMVKVLTGSNE
ncbi:PREDICTED: transcription factor UPBEAT1-like [Nelumbo nucifera]|uniref:Transcription factor UPBEAT1-like n=2 Tax=Nelumbo nucifera TaxID=4432 RepID=A0A822Z5M6_NELNU|nr:PREDICTED: transcription factor UPBEAT1-like [Nelumbo nucifera]DAD38296.1 TPA_asm: hypothetical protein HUJ06_008937 [Nelumbo nucifera]